MKRRFSRTEDFLAIVVGALLLLVVAGLYLTQYSSDFTQRQDELNAILAKEASLPFKSVEWHQAMEDLKSITGEKTKLGSALKKLTGKPSGWTQNPFSSMVYASAPNASDGSALNEFETQDRALQNAARTAREQAEAEGFKNASLNEEAETSAEAWKLHQGSAPQVKKSFNKWGWLALFFLLLGMLFAVAKSWMGENGLSFLKGFVFVFGLAFICQMLGAQTNAKELGLGYAAWAIVLGLMISNTIGTPQWVKPALSTEFFIKTGLVILGAEILFGKVLAIGLPGIFVAWIVTPIVLISTYWFGQRILKIESKTLNMTVSADMSVCGVSAAVATAAACNAKKEELTLAIGLSMIFTSIMMVVLPLVIGALGLPEVLGGAWIGGTIDATGAVVAAGAFLGDTALNVAATIKMIQNILIGIIAFGVAVYFTRKQGSNNTEVGWGEVWRRFPKFILGFIGASLIFSAIYIGIGDDLGYALIDKGVIGSWSKNIRGWLFCLAFVSIGLSTNFKELKKHFSGGKPLVLYVCGQAFNLCLTLLMAYIMFYLVFPHITETI
ncbi:MAG: YeiH family protein [Saprospiraceae bacterium]|nr:YeiH family protein [Saprospiraceae bacterium]